MKIAICDDNQEQMDFYMERLDALGKKYEIPLELVGYKSGSELLFECGDPQNIPDLIYLDICMPITDGIQTAKTLRSKKCKSEIVFLTMSENHVLDSFDVEPFHYIVKDKTTDRKFEQIFSRAANKVEHKVQEVVNFSCAGEVCTIPVKSIHYFEVQGRIVTVYYDEGEFEFYTTLNKVENMLWGKGFIRCHKSYVVALKHIRKVTYNEITLDTEKKIPLGRAYSNTLKQALKS